MSGIVVTSAGFSQDERIIVNGKNSYDIGKSYGLISRTLLCNMPHVLATKTSMHDAAYASYVQLEHLADTKIFTIGGRKYLREYLDCFKGFCTGAHIDLGTGALIQMEADPACQTIIAGDTNSSAVLLHMEENVDDDDIIRLHWNNTNGYKPQSLSENGTVPSYRYRMVDWKTPNEQLEFFAYPGLSSGGAGIGVNKTTGVIVAVDTFNPIDFTGGMLWSNAIASIVLSIGTIQGMQTMCRQLKKANISYYGGYAIHMLDRTGCMASLEFGGSIIRMYNPYKTRSCSYIAQTNYPRNRNLQSHDKYCKDLDTSGISNAAHVLHLGLSARERAKRLKRIAIKLTNMEHVGKMKELHRVVVDPLCDWERMTDAYVSNGFASPYVAGYCIASVKEESMNVQFHSMLPPQENGNPYYFWWPLDKKLPWGKDLFLHITP